MLDCEIVKDLLPLYTENMLSQASAESVLEHLQHCPQCAALHQSMCSLTPDVQFHIDEAEQFAAFQKKKRRKFGFKIAILSIIGTLLTVAVLFIARFFLMYGFVGALLLDSALAKIKTDTDPAHYSMYIGASAKKEYKNKLNMDESIFPTALNDDINVCEFKSVYYNPWDPQFITYLTVSYTAEQYEAEVNRLSECQSTEYVGYYSVTGFYKEPLAIYADSSYGFVYAIDTPGMENSITYCELIFCNYFMDLDYTEYIPAAYLPQGFNAHSGNPYRREALKKLQ